MSKLIGLSAEAFCLHPSAPYMIQSLSHTVNESSFSVRISIRTLGIKVKS